MKQPEQFLEDWAVALDEPCDGGVVDLVVGGDDPAATLSRQAASIVREERIPLW